MKNNFEKDGIVLLNKVKGVSSFGAINHLKRIVGAKKVGIQEHLTQWQKEL